MIETYRASTFRHMVVSVNLSGASDFVAPT
jgi:hypothetical protein